MARTARTTDSRIYRHRITGEPTARLFRYERGVWGFVWSASETLLVEARPGRKGRTRWVIVSAYTYRGHVARYMVGRGYGGYPSLQDAKAHIAAAVIDREAGHEVNWTSYEDKRRWHEDVDHAIEHGEEI